jgi:electron transport complex protein RnfB
MSHSLIDRIDALLPQTQCGECSYGACRPYATAIAEKGEALTRCPPGGVKTLRALGELLQQDVTPYIDTMAATTRPPTVAVIQEDLCIGCTKCIQVCPVDAIVGAAKLMHTVISDDCTGCRLCIEPCPMDCIDLLALEDTPAEAQRKADKARQHYERRQTRLEPSTPIPTTAAEISKKDYLAAALARAAQKRSSRESNE